MAQFEPAIQGRDANGNFQPEYFAYTVNFNGTLTGAAPTGTQTIQTQTDAPFVVERIKYNFIDAAAATEFVTRANQEIPDVTLQITDSATSKNFFFAPVQISLIASNSAEFPCDLPVPRLIIAGASLTFSIASVKTFANTNNLQIILEGYKKLRISN